MVGFCPCTLTLKPQTETLNPDPATLNQISKLQNAEALNLKDRRLSPGKQGVGFRVWVFRKT